MLGEGLRPDASSSLVPEQQHEESMVPEEPVFSQQRGTDAWFLIPFVKLLGNMEKKIELHLLMQPNSISSTQTIMVYLQWWLVPGGSEIIQQKWWENKFTLYRGKGNRLLVESPKQTKGSCANGPVRTALSPVSPRKTSGHLCWHVTKLHCE